MRDLEIKAADAVPADPATWPMDDDLVERVRLLREPSADEAARLANTLLESRYPEQPHLSRDLFEIVWEGALFDEKEEPGVTDEGVEVYRDEQNVEGFLAAEAVVSQLLETEGPVLVAWSSGIVGVTDVATVRERWSGLLSAGFVEDVTVFPEDASWALCAFHHGWLEVGRLSGDWPHRVRVV